MSPLHPSWIPPLQGPGLPDQRGGGGVNTGHGTIEPATGTQIAKAGGISAQSPQACKLVAMIVDGNNVQVPNTGAIILDVLQCLGSDGQYHTIYVQEVNVCIPNGDGTFTTKRAMMPLSNPY